MNTFLGHSSQIKEPVWWITAVPGQMMVELVTHMDVDIMEHQGMYYVLLYSILICNCICEPMNMDIRAHQCVDYVLMYCTWVNQSGWEHNRISNTSRFVIYKNEKCFSFLNTYGLSSVIMVKSWMETSMIFVYYICQRRQDTWRYWCCVWCWWCYQCTIWWYSDSSSSPLWWRVLLWQWFWVRVHRSWFSW